MDRIEMIAAVILLGCIAVTALAIRSVVSEPVAVHGNGRPV